MLGMIGPTSEVVPALFPYQGSSHRTKPAMRWLMVSHTHDNAIIKQDPHTS